MVTTIFITGSTGGIGNAIARRFAKPNTRLILHSHQKPAHPNTPALSEWPTLRADFADPNAAEMLYQQLFELTDHVDIFVNAAGLDLMKPDIAEQSFGQKLLTILQTDVCTPIMLGKKIGKRMQERGQGVLFFFGWAGVDYGWPGETAQLYGAAKGALLGFCRSLSEDLATHTRCGEGLASVSAPHHSLHSLSTHSISNQSNVASPNVLVRCLSLGWIKTRWGEKLSAELEQHYASDSRRNRWGTAEEVAAAVEFLTSEESRYLDGIGLRLDGEKRSRASENVGA